MTTAAEATFETRLALAREAVPELASIDGVVGGYFFGSGARPYADPNSDVDVAAIVEVARIATLANELKPLRARLQARHIDLAYYPDTILANARQDVERAMLARCHVLHDPTGAITAAKQRYAVVPDDIRQVRVRIHYFEVAKYMHRAAKSDERGDRAVALIATSEMIVHAAKMLFIERGEWPSTISWCRKELELLGVPVALTDTMYGLLDAHDQGAIRMFRHRLHRYLLDRGHSWVADPMAFMDWYYTSDEALRGRDLWCSPDRTE